MKNIIKFIIPILFLLSGFSANSQVKFIGTSNRFIVTGKGDIKGATLDNARIVNWSIADNTNFETTVYLESLSSGKAGIILRDANVTNNLNGGRPCYYLYLLKPENKIRLDIRTSVSSNLINLIEISNPASSGLWFNFKKVGNTLISRISTSPKSSIGTQDWTVINTTPNTALSNYTNFSRGIIVGSGSVTTNNATFSNWKINNIVTPPITIPVPTIASSVNPFVFGTPSVLSSTNCNYTVDWYKNNVFQSSGNTITVSYPVLNDIYIAKCKNGTNVSFASNELIVSSVVVNNNNPNNNTLVDRVIPTTTKWNYFDSDLLPDFVQAKNLDSKTGEMLPNKWAIWHAPNRNLFGNTQSEQLTKMFKKGWTAINATKIGGAFTGMESIITGDRIVVDGGFADDNASNPNDATYDAFESFAQTPFGYAQMYNIPKDNTGKWKVFLSDMDYEARYTSMNSQLSANYHVIAYNSGLSITTGRYGFMYGAANLSSYTTSGMYTGDNNSIWSLPADNSVKDIYRGKALSQNPRFVGRTEVSYYYESYLPQGYQVKDQFGNDWFKISHFGAECPASNCGANSVTNADSWASQLGALTEVNYKIHKQFNQDFIVQIKPVNERLDGFKYSGIHQDWYGNKYIQEYNRYGTVQSYGVSPIGSEYISPFISEAQVFLSYASGAKGISFWSSAFNDTSYPHDKATTQRSGARFDNVNALNADLDPYIYTMKALWRMNQKVDLGNGSAYSFNEICDGTEVYLNDLTKVVYPNSSTVTQLRAIDWQLLQKTPVRAVVNKAKNVVFVVAFQAYGAEQDKITFKLTDYGANISQVIDVPAGKVIVKAYPLTGTISQGTTIQEPSIVSSNNNAIAGQSVNLTSSGCSSTSTNKWYDNQEGNLLSSGLVYAVTVVNGNGYYAKCVSNSDNTSSQKSNIITFSITQKINVFILAGESNTGTRNIPSTLLTGESGLRTGVQIWNNNTNVLEQLNIGTNNYLDENAAIPNGWGMENELANLRANGTLSTDFIIIKTAQGGARIGNYNSDITPSPNYYDKMVSRINGVKSALALQNKTPVFYVIYSQGINNATSDGQLLTDNAHFPGLTGISYWKAGTKLYTDKIRAVTGVDTKFSFMKFFSPYGNYLNGAIQELVNENPNNFSFITSDLTVQADGLHFDSPGIRTATDRSITALGFQINSTVIPSSANVVITQLNREANYYKSATGLPQIIPTYPYSTNDNVYLSNDKIKVGFNLRYGGAITYLSAIGSTVNMVNNGYDGGRQIQPDYYQKPTNYTQNGKTPIAAWAVNGYNTTLGGDYYGNTVTLLDYHTVTDGFYMKLKPILWGFNGEITEIIIEVTYTLVGNSVKCVYNYINQRTDNMIPSGVNIVGWALPVAYLNQSFNQYYAYTGTSPFTNDVLTQGTVQSTGGKEANSKEFWSAMVNPTTGVGFGMYNKMPNHTDTYFQYTQANVQSGTTNEFSDGCTIFQLLDTYNTPDSHFQWNRTDTAYLIVGSLSEIRTKAYQLSGY